MNAPVFGKGQGAGAKRNKAFRNAGCRHWSYERMPRPAGGLTLFLINDEIIVGGRGG